MKIKVEIGELILNGFDKYNTMHIRESIENELAKLFAEGEIDSKTDLQNHNINTVNADSINIPHGYSNIDMVGASIAKSIYNSVGASKR